MATYVLRPNADWNNASVFTITGGSASVHAALADNSDATYITRTSTTIPSFYEAEFDTTTLAANEKIVSVNLRARIAVGTAGLAQFSLGVITDRNGRSVSYSVAGLKQNTFALGTVDFALNLTSAPNGSAWTQTLLDNLVFKFTDNATTSGDRTSVYAVYIDVLTTVQPTVTVTAPSGSVTTTSFPSVVWTYADADGDPQSAYEIKIFDAATYGGVSFDPNTSTASVQTGVITSTNQGQTLEVDLANSTNYRAYVRVAQSVNGDNYFSDWAFSAFSLDLDAPAAPSISVFYDATVGAVTLNIYGRTNFLSTNQASLEVDTTGWVSLTNCSIARSTAQASLGSASLSLTASSSADMTASTTNATKFTVIGNTQFSARAEFRANSTVRLCSVGIQWRTSANAIISTVFGTGQTNSSSAWTTATVAALAPATASFAMVVVKVASAGSGEIHYVDKIALHGGTTATYSRGGFSNFSFDVERSLSSEPNYTTVRGAPITVSEGQVATILDYEVPLDATVIYRAKARAEV